MPAVDDAAQQLLIAGEGEEFVGYEQIVGGAGIDAALVLDPLVFEKLQLLEFAALGLLLVDALDELGQYFRVAWADQQQPLLLVGISRRSGPVSEHEDIAENVVAQTGPFQLKVFAQIVAHASHALHLGRRCD